MKIYGMSAALIRSLIHPRATSGKAFQYNLIDPSVTKRYFIGVSEEKLLAARTVIWQQEPQRLS